MAACATQTTVYAYAGSGNSTKQAYELPVLNATDPATCTGLIVLSPADYKLLQGAAGPFDYTQAAAIFGFFFSFTVGCWLVAKNAGVILEFVKRM